MLTKALRATMLLLSLALVAGCKVQPDTLSETGTAAGPRPPAQAGHPPTTAGEAPIRSVDDAGPGAPAAPTETAGLPLPVLAPLPPPGGAPTGPAIVAAAPAEVGPRPALTADARAAVVRTRVDAVRAWLARTQRRAVLISEPADYAWLSAGAENQLGADLPAAALAVLPDRLLVVAPSDIIDGARAGLVGLGFTGRTYRWDLGRDAGAAVQAVRSLAGTGAMAADEHRPGTELVADDLARLRDQLSGFERQRLAWLGSATAAAVADAATWCTPEQTEAALQRQLLDHLRDAGLAPRDVRVTALDRLARVGLLPGGSDTIESGAALHVVASRWGLSVTVGRTVTPLPAEPATAAYATARELYAAVLGAVRTGAALRDVYVAADQAAGKAGAAETFRTAPPGGVGAFHLLEKPFAPQAVEPLRTGQAVTLSIRLARAYVADTLLLGDGEVRVVTTAAGWPCAEAYVNQRVVPIPTLRGAEQEVAAAERERAEAERRLAASRAFDSVMLRALEITRRRVAATKVLPAATAPARPEPPKVEAEPGAEATPERPKVEAEPGDTTPAERPE